MDCEQNQIWMTDALDGLLAPAERERLMDHVARCPACRADWAALQAVDELFSTAPMISAPADLVAQVQARLAHREAQRRTLMGGIILLLAALSLWLLALPSLLNGRGLLEAYALFLLDAYEFLGQAWLILRTLAQTLWLTLGAMIESGDPSVLNGLMYGLAGLLALLAWRRHMLTPNQIESRSANGH